MCAEMNCYGITPMALKADTSLADITEPSAPWRALVNTDANEGTTMKTAQTPGDGGNGRTDTPQLSDRRQHERFLLPHMYTAITVIHADGMRLCHEHGHVYDVSESGVRFELDRPLPIGDAVSFQIELPNNGGVVAGTGRIARLFDELDDPGPRRMALAVTRFATSDDRSRLMRLLGSGQLQRAA